MSKALQVFNFEKRDVRVVMKGSEPWFVAKDVCEVLELGNITESLRRLEDDEFSSTEVVDSLGRTQQMQAVNEPGLYSLVLGSRKPEAKAFKRWITHEVLPALRKTGSYSVKKDEPSESMKRADAMLNNSRVRLAKFIRETVKDIWDYLSPEAKQTYSAYVVEKATGQPGLIPLPVIEKTYTATELGTLFGVSANKIGRIANEHGIKTPEYGIEVLDKAKGHDKQVPTFRYNENGKEKLRVLLMGSETVQ